MIDRQLRRYDGKDDKVFHICHYYGNSDVAFNYTIFTDVIEMPFEGQMFFIPKDYDSYLKEWYGNYMMLPPIEDQVPRHEIVDIRL